MKFDITNRIKNVINPFNWKELAIAGAIALSVGAGSGYVLYNNIPVKEKVKQTNYKPVESTQTNNPINNNLVKIPVTKIKKTGKPRININGQPVSGKNIVINGRQKTNQNTKKRSDYQVPERYQPSNRAPERYQPNNKIPQSPNIVPQAPATQESRIPQKRTEGRKDGYNLVANYFPQGTTGGNGIRYHTDADTDADSIKIPSLGVINTGGRPQYQAIRITLDNINTEYFTEAPRVFLKDIDGNNLKLEDYFTVGYGKLNKTEINSILISPKNPLTTPKLEGGYKFIFETNVKNKYGTVENETLEVLVGGRQ